jgi:hypothetical protein
MATYRMVNGAELIYWEMIDFVHDQFLTKYFLTVENLSLGINVSKHLHNSWHQTLLTYMTHISLDWKIIMLL